MSKHEAFARQLLEAPDPVAAIAHLLADHERRLDIAFDRIVALEFAVGTRSEP